jgi:hypothetical protein
MPMATNHLDFLYQSITKLAGLSVDAPHSKLLKADTRRPTLTRNASNNADLQLAL